MTAHANLSWSAASPIRRSLTVLGATVASLLAAGGPVLAAPPPEPPDLGAGAGEAAAGVTGSTAAVTGALSTLQVVTISLLVSLLVGLVLLTAAAALMRSHRSRRTDATHSVQPSRDRSAVAEESVAVSGQA